MATPGKSPATPSSKQTASLQRHLNDLQANPLPFIENLELSVADGFNQLTGVMTGPDGSAYAGGKYQFLIRFLPTYPFKPPEFYFQTPISHPNVDEKTGTACHDHLLGIWAPSISLSELLIEMHRLLANPNHDSPIQAGS